MKLLFLAAFLIASTCYAYAQEADSVISESDRYEYKTGDHELFIMPTAHTMPARRSYLGNYELALFNYTLAIGPSTHLGIYALPLPPLFEFKGGVAITLLAKHSYYNSKTFSGAAWGMINVNGAFTVVGNTFSYELDDISLHGGFGYVIFTKSSGSPGSHGIFLLGAKTKIAGWLHGIVEYSNTPGQIYNIDKKFTGFGMAGLRYRDRHFALDIAAAKFFADENNDVFPVIKAVVYF